jgi:chromosome segregation ATPase
MNVEQIDWKLDEKYQSTLRKLSSLSEGAKHFEQRTVQLTEQLGKLEQQRIQVRANMLLGEPVDSDVTSIEESMEHIRQKLSDLYEEQDATSLAISTLQTALQQSEREAKRRVAERLVPEYREAVCSLHEHLRQCVEANKTVGRVHLIASKQNVVAVLAGTPAQKILNKNVALTFLNDSTLKEWEAVAAPILEADTDEDESKSRRIK